MIDDWVETVRDSPGRGGKRSNAGRKKMSPEQKKPAITVTLSPENLSWLFELAGPLQPPQTKPRVSGKLNELITLLRENPEILQQLHTLSGGSHDTK